MTVIVVSKFIKGELDVIKWHEEHESFDSVIQSLIDNAYPQKKWDLMLEEYTEAHAAELEEETELMEEEALVEFGDVLEDEEEEEEEEDLGPPRPPESHPGKRIRHPSSSHDP